MFSPLRNGAGKRLREPFGKAGLTVAVIALVFAMLGGAYATTSDGGKATSSAKAKKGPRGPKGAAGPAGPAGPAGSAGAKGDTGAAGSNGSNGANGKSAEVASFTGSKTVGGVTCTEGGLEVKSASATTLVCNGKKGTNGTNGDPGPAGSPWTVDGTLPSGKTETGSWAFGPMAAGAIPGTEIIKQSISFPIQLVGGLGASNVHFINANGKEEKLPFELEEVTSATCHGTAAAPTADPGNLCVYTAALSKAKIWNELLQSPIDASPGTSVAGAVLNFGFVEAGAEGRGTWAVTAPTAP